MYVLLRLRSRLSTYDTLKFVRTVKTTLSFNIESTQSTQLRLSDACCFIVGYGGVAPCPEHFAKPNVLPYSVFPVYGAVPFAARHDHHEEPCVVFLEGSPPGPEFPTHLQ